MTETGTAPNQNSAIKLEIQPMTFQVSIFVTGGGRNESGKATLTVKESGMDFQPASQGWHFNRLKPIEVQWGNLRELRRRNKRYTVNAGLGPGDFGSSDIILKFHLIGASSDQAGPLDKILEKLPPEASARRCPSCSGPVVKDKCKNCGKSFSLYQRKKGFWYLLAGALMVLVGISLSLSSMSSSSGKTTIYVGLILFGAVFAIFGLIRLLFGVRAG